MFFRCLLSLLLLSAVAAPSHADLWSPSTWISLPKSKPKSVSVAKSNKKSPVKPPSMHALTAPAQDFFAKSKSVISPSSGSSTASKASHNSRKAAEPPSMFHSMFAGESPKQPRTVSEWMAQKRPMP